MEEDRSAGFERILRWGAFVAAILMVVDGLFFYHTGNQAYLIFSSLAAVVLIAIIYAVGALRQGRIDIAVAVPLIYLLLVAPVGPALVPSRALISVALPFIAMAVAMNYGSLRHLRAYGIASWTSAVTVLGLWQWQMVKVGFVTPGFGVMNAASASVIVAFTFYALSRYSHRLNRSFDDVRTASAELYAAHEQLREVDVARVRFMNSAAHELSTPVTPIAIQLELLKRSKAAQEDERTRRSVEILDRNFQRLRHLVGDILDGARMDAGKLGMNRVPLDLSQVVEEAVEDYAHPALASGLHLETRIEPDLRVEGDPLRLRQVIDNLLSNAFKFTRPGGQVTVEALALDEDVCLVVSDTGIGIAPQQTGRLFHPFRQVHDPMKVVTPGSGLGLYIARGIVERHDGRIWVESRGLDQGTTFTVTLPRLDPDAEPTPGGVMVPDPVEKESKIDR